MDLRSFKQQMMPAHEQPEVDAPAELDPALVAFVSGGMLAPVSPGGVGGFANATWSKAM